MPFLCLLEWIIIRTQGNIFRRLGRIQSLRLIKLYLFYFRLNKGLQIHRRDNMISLSCFH